MDNGDFYENSGQTEIDPREAAFRLRMKAKQQKKEIRFIGSMLGGAIVLYIIITNVYALALSVSGLRSFYLSNSTFQFALDTVMTVAGILLPFLLAGRLIKMRCGHPFLVPTAPPSDTGLALLSVPAGLGLCMLGNVITSYIVSFSKLIGHEFVSPPLNYPEGVSGLIVSVLRVVLIAAFCEELAFRGVSLQPLRRHGQWFAVVCSACLFGLLHGNLVQAPFALLVGIGFGWICIKTGSIWPTILIHFLNNLFSVAVSYLSMTGSENVTVVESVVLYGLIAIGAVCAVFFVRRMNRSRNEPDSDSILLPRQKAAAFFLNVPMLIAIGYMIFVTAKYVN